MQICFAIAGLMHFGIASANFFAIRMFRYREALEPVPESVRQVFWVQNGFIVLTVGGMGIACLLYPAELSTGAGLGRGACIFLAAFWGFRLVTQLAYYSPAKRQEHRYFDILFLSVFVYLTGLFSASAIGFWRP